MPVTNSTRSNPFECCYEKLGNCTASSPTVTSHNGDYLKNINPKSFGARREGKKYIEASPKLAHFKCYERMSEVARKSTYSSYLEPVAAVKGAIDTVRGKQDKNTKGDLFEKGYNFGSGFAGGEPIGKSGEYGSKAGHVAGRLAAAAFRKFIGPKGQLLVQLAQSAPGPAPVNMSRAIGGRPAPLLITDGRNAPPPRASSNRPAMNQMVPGTNRFVVDVSQAFKDSKGYYLNDESGRAIPVHSSSQGYSYIEVR